MAQVVEYLPSKCKADFKPQYSQKKNKERKKEKENIQDPTDGTHLLHLLTEGHSAQMSNPLYTLQDTAKDSRALPQNF
jgi:hypothetical protein